ncbi:hypothetical protein HS088_TW23G00482 [Tripterygium wilfordii]|uniref:Uncharacterized protein n=1 Tax=Tripterygium wilfordii TaxID=458696 RepID=A0A7J7BV78_TRIWF|nr:hypothetical protein HS088_TW23G00482 [Tripterygium wilfordii]
MRALIGGILFHLLISHAFTSSAAVPTTRSLKSIKENPFPIQDLVAQGAMELGGDDEGVFEIGSSEEEFIEGRMDMETTDYPGTGANNHHDPNIPARA